MTRSVRLAVIVLAAVVAGAVAWRWLAPPPERAVTSSGTALIGGPFSLVDHRGQAVTDRDYRGRYMLVQFGYTHCPDMCPLELQNMTEALDLLGPEARAVQPLFITIDPARDTVGVMATYVANFHDSLVGLTGSGEQVAAAAKVYRVFYRRAEPGDGAGNGDENYLLDHSTPIYLMDRQGRYLAHFSPATTPQQMADRLAREIAG